MDDLGVRAVGQRQDQSPRSDDRDGGRLRHGAGHGRGDVEIVWRADVDGNNSQEWIDRVSVCPPSMLEAISVPIG